MIYLSLFALMTSSQLELLLERASLPALLFALNRPTRPSQRCLDSLARSDGESGCYVSSDQALMESSRVWTLISSANQIAHKPDSLTTKQNNAIN